MTYLNQPLSNTNENSNADNPSCLTAAQLANQNINNRQDRERDYRNCGKLSGQKIPHSSRTRTSTTARTASATTATAASSPARRSRTAREPEHQQPPGPRARLPQLRQAL